MLASVTAGHAAPDQARQIHAAAIERGKEIKRLWKPSSVHAIWPAGDGDVWFATEPRPMVTAIQAVGTADGTLRPALDVEKLAAALAKATGKPTDAASLRIGNITRHPDGLVFRHLDQWWKCALADYSISKAAPGLSHLTLSPPGKTRRHGGPEISTHLVFENTSNEDIVLAWLPDDRSPPEDYGTVASGKSSEQHTYSGHRWQVRTTRGAVWGEIVAPEGGGVVEISGPAVGSSPPKRENRRQPAPQSPGLSPDGRWTVTVQNHQVFLAPAKGGTAKQLTTDGSPKDFYQERTVRWSPDSRTFAIQRLAPVKPRKITLTESSPADQVQPKYRTIPYPKPGDDLDRPAWRLFDAASGRMLQPDDSLCPTPWELSDEAWSPDGSTFQFLYNQRGHQVLRLIGLDARNGKARVLLEETSKTFIDYSQKTWLHRLPDTREFLWASERSGWNHLYLHDARDGSLKHAVTSGNWNVKSVEEVDEENRRLLLRVVGLNPAEDPYHEHFVRVDFDGKNFVRLTDGDGTQDVAFSPDGRWLLATWSRVDHPPATELRDARDGRKIATLSVQSHEALTRAGWQMPERFTAPGRDGRTPIHGIITRPSKFDPARKYPVIENIYAGPHDAHVRKSFRPWTRSHELAECGFIVVEIDGMGTNWRGKAFHDVAWKNLKDAGLPDRIAWMKSAAATRPWMDLERVGIFGGSAGGQNALSALLHHGDFYKVAVADCGCHDNRMDKIWWNEAWMGWPVDESYADNSNVTHAARLQGELLLIVGELDDNVDPASTMQVVHALQKADKDFDLLIMTGTGHGAAESPYANRRRAAFFIEHLNP